MTVCCLFGKPISHSLSPDLHNACYKAMGMNWKYVSFSPETFYAGLDAVRNLNIRGVSVTIPFKEDGCNNEFFDVLSPGALATGAVSAIVNDNGALSGYNTDLDGLKRCIDKDEISGKSVVVFGAGGVAKSCILFAQRCNASKITVISKNDWRINRIQKLFDVEFSEEMVEGDILFNASSVGLNDDCPWSESVINNSFMVIDLPYVRYKRTVLELTCFNNKIPYVSGQQVLLGLAKEQFRLFTGTEAPIGVMEAVLQDVKAV